MSFFEKMKKQAAETVKPDEAKKEDVKKSDIKSEVNKKELESQGNEVQGEVIVSGDRSKKEATILKSVAKYLI